MQPALVAIRLPALLATAAFGLLCAYLCCWAGWYFSAPLIALGCWHPFLVTMSQSSRGYSLSLFLTTLWVVLLVQLIKSPRSLWLGGGMALTAVCTYQTMINLLVNWVAPVYLIVLVIPRWFCSRIVNNSQTIEFRRNLFLQSLNVMAVGFVFFVDRLPYVYSSAMQYGLPVASFGQGLREMAGAASFLFPGRLQAFAPLATAGAVLAIRQRPARLLPTIYGIAPLASLIYFFASFRFPYQRNFGVFLPLFFFGYAAAVQAGLDLAAGSRAGTVAVVIASLLLTAWWIPARLADGPAAF